MCFQKPRLIRGFFVRRSQHIADILTPFRLLTENRPLPIISRYAK